MAFNFPVSVRALLVLFPLVLAGPVHAQHTLNFSTSDPGVAKAIPNWGLDTNWASADNMRRGLSFMGTDNVNVIRVPAMMDKPLDSGLTSDQEAHLQQCMDIAAMASPTAKWDLCAPGSDTVNAWFQNGTGTVDVNRWVLSLRLNQEFFKHPMWMVEPFNEPDYATWGEGSMKNLYDIMGGLQGLSNFAGAALAGGSTMSTDQAAAWYDALGTRVSVGTTHGLYGTASNYVGFIQHVAATNGVPIHPEGHNVVEAIIGAEYGLKGMIWWGTAELARGNFVKASQGVRLGYAEDWPNWTAAAVYRAPSGAVQAFLGSSERVGGTTTYTLHATDRDVYYDGHGPQRDYTVTISRNQERVIAITWGSDVQPVIGGRYAIVNASSGLCLEVAGASTTAAAVLQQNAYVGANNQLWDVSPVAANGIGDLSYFLITNANSKLNADLADWAFNDGAPVKQYGAPANAVEHWYFEYTGNGYFHIRSRWSNKGLGVSSAGQPLGAAAIQRSVDGASDQLWRLQSPATMPTSQPLRIDTQPRSLSATAGQTMMFSVGAVGTGKLSYQWLFNGAPIVGMTGAQLVLTNVSAANAGSYSVIVTDINGSVTSLVATLTLTVSAPPPGPHSNLVNIATRAYCGMGNSVTIGGFVVSGSVAKSVLVRAVGPSLTAQGLSSSEVLLDPTIEVHDAIHGNAIIAANDNWGDSDNPAAITSTGVAVGAGPLLASDTQSAALVLTLNPGVYSFVVNGKGATSGVVLLEVYDADSVTTGSSFVNIATRAYATTGNGVTIGGFVISGNAPKQVLLRAMGPTLTTQGLGVPEVLADPTIELHDASHGNKVIASNDNSGDNANAAAILTAGARIGATPYAVTDPKSAALLVSLQPGVYSFVASGKGATSGIVLVEVYDAD
jgi:hypothetical protein